MGQEGSHIGTWKSPQTPLKAVVKLFPCKLEIFWTNQTSIIFQRAIKWMFPLVTVIRIYYLCLWRKGCKICNQYTKRWIMFKMQNLCLQSLGIRIYRKLMDTAKLQWSRKVLKLHLSTEAAYPIPLHSIIRTQFQRDQTLMQATCKRWGASSIMVTVVTVRH